MWRRSAPESVADSRRTLSRVGTLALVCVLSMGRVVAQSSTAAASAPVERWYGHEQVERGALVYAQICAVCHGQNGEGTEKWRERTDEGKFPPPPIDGTGHAWHHPIKVLGSQIKFGAPGGLGTMPGFADRLSDEQIVDVIAWLQDKWPDKVYAAWVEIELRSRSNN